MDIKEKKRMLRGEMKARIAALPAGYCAEADRKITDRLCSLDIYRQADVLFVYVGGAGEIDTMPFIRKALAEGKRVGVPLCTAPGIMEVRGITGEQDLSLGAYGIMEPEAACPLIRPDEIALAVIPCLSCTREGVRLGHGGGYYDRYLRQVRGCRLILCRERMLSGDLPAEPHDMRGDGVITETSYDICP